MGRLARIDPDGKVSIVESSGGIALCGPWYWVGTPDQVSGQIDRWGRVVSDLVLGNPPPYNADPWIPFNDPWNNTLGVHSPVSFMLSGCFFFVRGAAGGGDEGTAIFNVPMGFRTLYDQDLTVATGLTHEDARCIAQANGDMVYMGTIP